MSNNHNGNNYCLSSTSYVPGSLLGNLHLLLQPLFETIIMTFSDEEAVT